MTNEHHNHDKQHVGVAVLTISSTRTVDSDDSGDAVVDALKADGHTILARDLVADENRAIRASIEEFTARDNVDAIVTTGGTGLTPDDVTVDALSPLFDRDIPGFGEQFRARSVAEVGPHAMLSRATAGVIDGVVVFCIPGSENAARFGTTELVIPVLGHAVGLLTGNGVHGQDTDRGEQSGDENANTSHDE